MTTVIYFLKLARCLVKEFRGLLRHVDVLMNHSYWSNHFHRFVTSP